MSNDKKQRLTTPAGIAKFPRLNTPDTKWKEEGQFKVTLVLEESAPGVAKFLTSLRNAEKAVRAEVIKNPKQAKFNLNESIRPATDKDGNEVPGSVEVTFKTTASGTRKDGSKWERKIRMFDAKGHPTEAKVGGGSTLKVSYTFDSYTNPAAKSYGISLYLEAVQILDLVEYSGEAGASDYGFGEEEGFQAEGSEFAEPAEDESSAEESDGSAEDAPTEDSEPVEDDDAPAEEAPAAKPAPSKKTPAPKPAAKPSRGRGNF